MAAVDPSPPRRLHLDCDLGQVLARGWGEADAPVVVMLHRMLGSEAQFDHVGPALARRGSPLDWTQSSHVRQLWQALDNAGYGRVVLLGDHMGGEVALDMALQRPGE